MKKLLIFMLIALPSITACGQQPKTKKATQPNTADIKVYEQRMDSLQKEYGKLVEAYQAAGTTDAQKADIEAKAGMIEAGMHTTSSRRPSLPNTSVRLFTVWTSTSSRNS